MVFNFKRFKLTTTSCFYAITLMVLSGFNELRCDEHAQDFQKNSKCLPNAMPLLSDDFVAISIIIKPITVQSRFSSCSSSSYHLGG